MSRCAGDPFQFVVPCKWQNDLAKVVLEIQSETSKSCSDAAPCSIRGLLQEMEEEGMIDTTLHHHSVQRPDDMESSAGTLGKFMQFIY